MNLEDINIDNHFLVIEFSAVSIAKNDSLSSILETIMTENNPQNDEY